MKNGFTLIELVMIIVILGILAAVAIPRFVDMQADAQLAAERGVVGGIRAGLLTYYADECRGGSCAWPSNLDSASSGACSSSNPCFDNVLMQGGIVDDWTASGAGVYTGPAGGVYTYNSSTGEFN